MSLRGLPRVFSVTCMDDMDAVFVPAKDLHDLVRQEGMAPVIKYIADQSEGGDGLAK